MEDVECLRNLQIPADKANIVTGFGWASLYPLLQGESITPSLYTQIRGDEQQVLEGIQRLFCCRGEPSVGVVMLGGDYSTVVGRVGEALGNP